MSAVAKKERFQSCVSPKESAISCWRASHLDGVICPDDDCDVMNGVVDDLISARTRQMNQKITDAAQHLADTIAWIGAGAPVSVPLDKKPEPL